MNLGLTPESPLEVQELRLKMWFFFCFILFGVELTPIFFLLPFSFRIYFNFIDVGCLSLFDPAVLL